ncbi:MAG: hypothetical protein ACLUHE_04675 [Christensenellales bacterium]
MYYIYHNAVKLNNFGYGCALGIILAIIIAIFSALQFRLSAKRVRGADRWIIA